MTPSIKKLALSLGLIWAVGYSFAPLGCGGSGGGLGPAVTAQGDAEVPEGIARQIRTCAADHMAHLGPGERSVSFDVKLSNDGEVDSVALRESTLGDEELEVCMARALRSLSEGDLPMRRSDSFPRGPVTPESRELLGQEEALVYLALSPCLLTVGFPIGVGYVAVQIYVHATSHAAGDCDDKYQDCQAHGPKSCLKEEAGKSLCQRCLERCNAGDSPSAKCRKCKF